MDSGVTKGWSLHTKLAQETVPVGDLPLALDTPVLLIDLPIVGADGEPGRLYRIGTVNFSAILHYNRSYFYATAVTELAAALRQRQPGAEAAR